MDTVHQAGDYPRGRALIPGSVTVARLLIGPWLYVAIAKHASVVQIIGLILFVAMTDALDGHLARALGVASPLGSYMDACADYGVIIAAFAAFVLGGVYPIWVAALITAMFLQFLLTSGRTGLRYDPIGKFYGALLFGMVGITVAFPDSAVMATLLLTLIGVTVISLTCRYLTTLRAVWHSFATPPDVP